MPKTHAVVLTDEQRHDLDRLVNTGRESARKITRARVLLKAADGETDGAIAVALGVSVRTAERVRRRFAEGLDAAVERRPQPPRPAKRVLDGDGRGEADHAGLLDAAGRARPLDAGPAGRPHGAAELLPGRVAGHGRPPPQKSDAQAVAEGRVGDPAQRGRRVRRGHGGRAGGVQAAARPVLPGRGRGREAGPVDGPRPRPAPAPAGGRGQGGPRVQAEGDGQPVRRVRAAGRVAALQGDGAADPARLRPLRPRPAGRPVPLRDDGRAWSWTT